MMQLHGRLLAIEQNGTTLRLAISTETGTKILKVKSTGVTPRAGDIIEVSGHNLKILTPNRTNQNAPAGAMTFHEKILTARRKHGVATRMKVEKEIRRFFEKRKFLETRTPLLVPCPGMEPHIRPFAVRASGENAIHSYLPTSPEFAMKRLLVAGLEKIFQITPAFRAEPQSTTHLPEFTMLEWYRAYAKLEDIMRDTEELVAHVAKTLHGRYKIKFTDKTISVKTPWPRLKIRDLFMEHAGVDLLSSNTAEKLAEACRRHNIQPAPSDTWDDLYFRLWLNVIEPKLPADKAVFVTDYPPSQAALAVVATHDDGSKWARRFEFYAGGIELGNAFEELTDPVEQRKRFIEDMELREQIYGSDFPKNPLDEDFLRALEEGMPPSAGIAVGVDRLVMLMADEPDIANTFWT